jgi:aminoglycoside phosphotransferase (APT) family kinase protein
MTVDGAGQPTPPAAGVRIAWEALPAWLRRVIEKHLGAQVVQAVNQPGGFSPGVAARVLLDDGRRVFVKAAGAELNPDTPALHRAEAQVLAAMPANVPVPRLLAVFDQARWVALVLEDIDGVPPALPWRPAELERVLAALDELSVLLTPSPVAVPSIGARLDSMFVGWRDLQASPDASVLARVLPGEAGSWVVRHVERLAGLERGWADAVAGNSLVHGDVRADNLLLTGDRVVVVDWPWASVGAPWADLVLLAPSVAMQGGPAPDVLLQRSRTGTHADAAAVSAVVAALAGYLVWQSLQPAPPGLPTIRPFQAAQAGVALSWLRRRTGWA